MKHGVFTQFEHDAIDFLLQGELEVLKLLRYQFTKIISVTRWYSGVGFAHSFDLDKEGLRKTSSISGVKDNFEITDVKAYLNGDIYNVGIILFVRDGYIDWLEGVNIIADNWPENIDNYRFLYLSEED